jgi:hypothetical protein
MDWLHSSLVTVTITSRKYWAVYLFLKVLTVNVQSQKKRPPATKNDLVDFFSSVDEPQAGPSSSTSGMGAFGGADPFSQQQQMLLQQQQQLQSQMMMNQHALSGLPNPFMQGMMQQPQQPQMNSNPFMMQPPQQQQQQFVPSYQNTQPPVFTPPPSQSPQQQGPSSVNVMKTNNAIDPFASLAASRTST